MSEENSESIDWTQTILFLYKIITEKLQAPDLNYIYITICIIIILIVYFTLKFFTSKNFRFEFYDKKENYNSNKHLLKETKILKLEIKILKLAINKVVKKNKKLRKEINIFKRNIHPRSIKKK